MQIPHFADLIIPDTAFPPPSATAGDHTGIYAWPAGDRLARDLPTLLTCGGLRVLDLGCGRGHLGLSALRMGAAEVVFADGNPEVRAGVEAVCAANGFKAPVIAQNWGDAVAGAPFDIVLGGDLLYRPEQFPALLTTIRAALDENGLALLSDPRLRLEQELPGLAHAAALTWCSERRRDYTLVRVRPRR